MEEVPFYIGKPKDEQNKIPSFLKTYRVNRGAYTTNYMSDLLSDDIIVTDARNANLSKLYYKNMERVKQQKVPKTLPSSWKDNIDYTKGYNSEIEDKFRSEHDYLGLADYLSKFKMNNVIDQRAYEQEISQIRRYGRQYNAIQANATDEQENL